MDPRLVALRDALPGMVVKGSGRVSYHLRGCIGEGGQGWVFTANWDEPGGFVVIVKVLRPDAYNADTLARFKREAEVLQMLSQQAQPNPHVVRFFDHAHVNVRHPVSGEVIALPFTVLEYVSGVTLEQVLLDTPRGLPIERTRRILRQVSMALEMVHGHRVVHRDLKPSNILLASQPGGEVAKVTDFGLVKLVDVGLQRTATLAGATLGYAPPEQYEQGNRRVSARTDVFSLSAIAYEMLTGRPAFPYADGENPLLIVTRIMNGPRPSILRDSPASDAAQLAPELKRRPDLAAAIDAQLQRALSPDPNDRHASIEEFWNSIEPAMRAAIGPSVPPARVDFGETLPADTEAVPGVGSRAYPSGGSIPVQSIPLPSVHLPSRSAPPMSQGGIVSRAPGSDLTTPSQWKWRVVVPPVRPGIVRSAVFQADGKPVAVGPQGIARLTDNQWSAVSIPPNLMMRFVRGVTWLPEGDLLLYGDVGTVLRLTRAGLPVAFAKPDNEAALYGALVDAATDTIILVGQRSSGGSVERTTSTDRVGYVAVYVGGRIAHAADAAPAGKLSSVARLAGTFVAVGDKGALVRIERNRVQYMRSVCGGDLYAMAPMLDGTCVAVGAGGHALRITAQGDAQLEAVQTTRDLMCVAVSEEGIAWAGSQARVLRRTIDSWVRMSGDLGIDSTIVALHVRSPREVCAVCDDGAVLDGRLGA
jgi:serine/threonine-protein kinase